MKLQLLPLVIFGVIILATELWEFNVLPNAVSAWLVLLGWIGICLSVMLVAWRAEHASSAEVNSAI